MTRKLRNSINALLLTAAVCATAAFAIAGAPLTSHHVLRTTSVAATSATADTHRRVAPSSRIRHLMAVPYFSFVTRG